MPNLEQMQAQEYIKAIIEEFLQTGKAHIPSEEEIDAEPHLSPEGKKEVKFLIAAIRQFIGEHPELATFAREVQANTTTP